MMVSVMTPASGRVSSDRPARMNTIDVSRFHQKPGALRPPEITAIRPKAPPSSSSHPTISATASVARFGAAIANSPSAIMSDAVDDEPGAVLAQRGGFGRQSDRHGEPPCSIRPLHRRPAVAG